MARRDEGSIYWSAGEQRWVAQVKRGGQKRRAKCLTKPEAREKLKELLAGLGTAATKDTVAEYLGRWLEDTVKTTRRTNTYECYRKLVVGHINPAVGSIALPKLTAPDVQGMLAAMERAGRSPNLRRLARAVLRRALGQAVKWRLIQINPVDMTEAPRIPESKKTIWTEQQAQAFLATAAQHRPQHFPIFYLALTTGMRIGEILGLQWADVDLAAGCIVVRQKLLEIGGHTRGLEDVKTAAGNRRIALAPGAVVVLKQHQAALMARGLRAAPMVFPLVDRRHPEDPPGYYLRGTVAKVMDWVAKTAGVPRARVHDLRHCSATLLMRAGVNPKIVQARLGHSSVTVTLGIYGHVMPGMDEGAAGVLEQAMEGKK